MEEDDPTKENTIEDDGIGVVDNVLAEMIQEYGNVVADQDDHDGGTSASDNDEEYGLDIPIPKKAYKLLY